jgi:hypothetical protein
VQLEDLGSKYKHVWDLIRAAKGTDEDAVEDAA